MSATMTTTQAAAFIAALNMVPLEGEVVVDLTPNKQGDFVISPLIRVGDKNVFVNGDRPEVHLFVPPPSPLFRTVIGAFVAQLMGQGKRIFNLRRMFGQPMQNQNGQEGEADHLVIGFQISAIASLDESEEPMNLLLSPLPAEFALPTSGNDVLASYLIHWPGCENAGVPRLAVISVTGLGEHAVYCRAHTQYGEQGMTLTFEGEMFDVAGQLMDWAQQIVQTEALPQDDEPSRDAPASPEPQAQNETQV